MYAVTELSELFALRESSYKKSTTDRPPEHNKWSTLNDAPFAIKYKSYISKNRPFLILRLNSKKDFADMTCTSKLLFPLVILFFPFTLFSTLFLFFI